MGIPYTLMLSSLFPSLSVILQFSIHQVRFGLRTLKIVCLSIHTIIQSLRLVLCQVSRLAMSILVRIPMAMFGLDYLSFLPLACWSTVARNYFEVFRILVLGRSNAGKTTILQRVCSTTEQPEIFDGNGKKVCHNLATSLGTLLIYGIQISMDVVQGSIGVRMKSITFHMCWHFPAGRA